MAPVRPVPARSLTSEYSSRLSGGSFGPCASRRTRQRRPKPAQPATTDCPTIRAESLVSRVSDILDAIPPHIRCHSSESLEFPRPEPMLVFHHIDPLTMKANAFHFETRTLLHPSFAPQLDLAARAHYALPRQRTRWRLTQQPRHLAMMERVSRGRRNLRVSGYFAARNLADGFAKSGVSRLALRRAQKPAISPADLSCAAHSESPAASLIHNAGVSVKLAAKIRPVSSAQPSTSAYSSLSRSCGHKGSSFRNAEDGDPLISEVECLKQSADEYAFIALNNGKPPAPPFCHSLAPLCLPPGESDGHR